MAISGEINLFGFRNSMELWILNIGIVAVGGQQCLYDYISQFQSVSRLPKEDSSTSAGQTSQQDFKRNGLSGEDLWQVEHRWPRSWKLHVWIGHEPGAKFSGQNAFDLLHMLLTKLSWATNLKTGYWPPTHTIDLPNLAAHNDLHHLHWVAELRWLLCRQSFLCYCKSHRSAQDPSGHYEHWAFFSNVTQAVGKDGIYPGVGWFEKGGNANNDPIRGEVVFASLPQIYYLAY